MGQPGCYLTLQSGADVHVRLGNAAGKEPHFLNRMGQESYLGMFGKGQVIPRQGVNGIQCGAPDDAVVAMGNVGWLRVFRVMRKKDAGLPTTNRRDNLTAQRMRILDLAVAIAQKGDLGKSQPFGGLLGFGFPLPCNGGRRSLWVAGAKPAGGDKQQTDLGTGVAGLGQRAATPTFNIIRMGSHRHD